MGRKKKKKENKSEFLIEGVTVEEELNVFLLLLVSVLVKGKDDEGAYQILPLPEEINIYTAYSEVFKELRTMFIGARETSRTNVSFTNLYSLFKDTLSNMFRVNDNKLNRSQRDYLRDLRSDAINFENKINEESIPIDFMPPNSIVKAGAIYFVFCNLIASGVGKEELSFMMTEANHVFFWTVRQLTEKILVQFKEVKTVVAEEEVLQKWLDNLVEFASKTVAVNIKIHRDFTEKQLQDMGNKVGERLEKFKENIQYN